MIYQWYSEAKLSGRVRDKTGKEQIAKQLSSMDDMPRFDMETGQIKSKKAKKEKSPQDKAIADVKALEKKLLGMFFCAPCSLW